MSSKSIAILQPIIPHYRIDFFRGLQKSKQCDIYVYNTDRTGKKEGFKLDFDSSKHIANISFKGILLYSPIPFLSKRYDTLVLMLHFAHITTWLLLVTKFIHRKKIILWGQGISNKRYIKEQTKPNWKLKWMISLSDGVWLYMEKEKQLWQKIFPKKKIIALNNTITGIENILSYTPVLSKEVLKKKFSIKEKILIIFCARFNSIYRRTDLLIEVIKKLNPNIYGFIIIGNGNMKPDFSNFPNVHDFGAVYDSSIKQDLFSISDIYFQPGWIGLSIVEAMAYGKPVFTFERSNKIKHGVEYSYIQQSYNGMLFKNIGEFIKTIEHISSQQLVRMGENARLTAKVLTPTNMVKKAISIL